MLSINNVTNGANGDAHKAHYDSFLRSGSDISSVNGLPFYKPIPADITLKNHKSGDPSKILFKNVVIFDSTGADTYPGDVLIEGERISQVGKVEHFKPDNDTLVIDGKGKMTLMSGLVDAHTHLSWNDAPTMDSIVGQKVEEHLLDTAYAAKTYLDCGYTMCFSAAAARARLDIAVKNYVRAGKIPGPRILSNSKEIATTGGAIAPPGTTFADGEEGMRKAVRETIALGVDNVKLSMTGDYIHPTLGSDQTYFTLQETKAAVEEAHNRGKRVAGHCRSRESVKLACLAGLDVIYHASFVDEEGLDMLEKLKDRVFVAPSINFPYATLLGDAAPYGLTKEMATKRGMKHEVEVACKAMAEMHKRGIRVLPGGDFGFAWTPHGTYAKDLAHFVNLFGYTPKESLLAATALGGEIMGYPEELGKVQPGYYADVILVNGNPLENIEILQDRSKLQVIVINGHVHKSMV